MCRINEIDDNLQALDAIPGPVELAQFEADKHELGTVFCRRCDYCMPCPYDLPLTAMVIDESKTMLRKAVELCKLTEEQLQEILKSVEKEN